MTAGTKEHINHAEGDQDAWICVCGNMPTSDGFYPCDEKGNEMEPVQGWGGLYVCARCGRIIDQRSLDVVGRNPESQFLQ